MRRARAGTGINATTPPEEMQPTPTRASVPFPNVSLDSAPSRFPMRTFAYLLLLLGLTACADDTPPALPARRAAEHPDRDQRRPVVDPHGRVRERVRRDAGVRPGGRGGHPVHPGIRHLARLRAVAGVDGAGAVSLAERARGQPQQPLAREIQAAPRLPRRGGLPRRLHGQGRRAVSLGAGGPVHEPGRTRVQRRPARTAPRAHERHRLRRELPAFSRRAGPRGNPSSSGSARPSPTAATKSAPA